MLADELLTYVFQSVSFAYVDYVHAVRATCRLGRDAMEDVFLLHCSPTRFTLGMALALQKLTHHDRMKMERTASQWRAHEEQVEKLKGIATARFKTAPLITTSYFQATQQLVNFVRFHLFVLRNMHPEIKLLAQHVLYWPLWNEVHLQRRAWRAHYNRVLRTYGPIAGFGDYDNDTVLLQQLLPLPPVPPHSFSSIWEREVGFVDMSTRVASVLGDTSYVLF